MAGVTLELKIDMHKRGTNRHDVMALSKKGTKATFLSIHFKSSLFNGESTTKRSKLGTFKTARLKKGANQVFTLVTVPSFLSG